MSESLPSAEKHAPCRWCIAHERRRMEIEQILDRVLGPEADDGAGSGLVADVELAIERVWDEAIDALVSAMGVLPEVWADVIARTKAGNPYCPIPPEVGQP